MTIGGTQVQQLVNTAAFGYMHFSYKVSLAAGNQTISFAGLNVPRLKATSLTGRLNSPSMIALTMSRSSALRFDALFGADVLGLCIACAALLIG